VHTGDITADPNKSPDFSTPSEFLAGTVQLHFWDESYGLISHLSYVPAGYEEVAMLSGLTDEARAKLLARNPQDYQELCKSEYDR